MKSLLLRATGWLLEPVVRMLVAEIGEILAAELVEIKKEAREVLARELKEGLEAAERKLELYEAQLTESFGAKADQLVDRALAKLSPVPLPPQAGGLLGKLLPR